MVWNPIKRKRIRYIIEGWGLGVGGWLYPNAYKKHKKKKMKKHE